MLETRSGRFPRFIWSDPTRPSADIALRVERTLRERFGASPTHRQAALLATITAMACHLRAAGEPPDRALAAIRRELRAAVFSDTLSRQDAALGPAMLDTVVCVAIDSCYETAEAAA